MSEFLRTPGLLRHIEHKCSRNNGITASAGEADALEPPRERGGFWIPETHPTPNQGTGSLGSQGCPLTLPLSRLKITGQIGLKLITVIAAVMSCCRPELCSRDSSLCGGLSSAFPGFATHKQGPGTSDGPSAVACPAIPGSPRIPVHLALGPCRARNCSCEVLVSTPPLSSRVEAWDFFMYHLLPKKSTASSPDAEVVSCRYCTSVFGQDTLNCP